MGTRPAFVVAVLYEVLAPGYHSPLTEDQIAELFQAGRIGRHHRCKQVRHKEWRTVDELFPLLKYESATISCDSSWELADPSGKKRGFILAFLGAACAIAVWYYFAIAASSGSDRYHVPVTETRWPKTVSPSLTADHSESVPSQTNLASDSARSTAYASPRTEVARVELAARRR